MRCSYNALSRRDFIAIGTLGASQFALPAMLQAGAAGKADSRGASSGILIFLDGGPSHQDTFDLKPSAPSEYRGEFKPIATNVPGIQICEHLPNLAQQADKFAILHGVTHTLAAHGLGTEYVQTGTRPLASLKYPAYGAVMIKERPATISDIPPNIAIERGPSGAGFLGVRYAPFKVGNLAGMGKEIPLRGIELPNSLPLSEFVRRHELLEDLDNYFRSLEANRELMDGLDEFSQQAQAIISSNRTRDAFDLSQESPAFTKLFGSDGFSQGCLLAIRLVEAGVRFVTLSFSGWDTHASNFSSLENNLLPSLDKGLTGLLAGLTQRGLLESTAVLVTGEFGRTPEVNENAGRDHYPRCMSMLMAGGRISGGRVVGESDETASRPVGDGYSPDDVAATFYSNLGIDPKKTYQVSGRPITLVRDGDVIDELLG